MTTSLFDQLRDADPARGLAGYGDAYLSASAHSISSRSVEDHGTSPDRARRGVPRSLLLVAPVAAAAAALLVIAPALTKAPSASADAVTMLTQAAQHLTAVDPTAKPGQWWEVRTTGFSLGIIDTASTDPGAQVAILESRNRTAYLSADGSQPSYFADGPASLVRQLAGEPVTSAELASWLDGSTEGWTTGLAPNDTPGTWQGPNPAFLAQLPRDASALRQRLYDDSAGGGNSTDGEAFVYVADILRSGVVPADLRSALYRVLATIPGGEITSRAATVGTASGIAFGRYESHNGTRTELVIDPANGDLVGERDVATQSHDGISAGTVTGQTVVTRTLVDAVPPTVVNDAQVLDCNVATDGTVFCIR